MPQWHGGNSTRKGTQVLALVIIIVLVLLALALIIGGISSGEGGATGGGIVTLIVAIAIAAFSMTATVGAKEVGVKVAYGKTHGALGSGMHVKSPWTKVVKFDGTIQNDTYNGDNQMDVRLGNNSKAQADVSIRWQLKVDNAEQLYVDYRDPDKIKANLVDRNLRSAMNEAFAEYNPLADTAAAGDDQGDVLGKLAASVKEKLQAKVGDLITIHDVVIPILNFDDATQQKIDQLQAEIAQTRVAEQKKQTADAEAAANRALSGSLSDEVLTSKCLDIVDKDNESPLGCFPGTSASPVINK